MQTTNTLSTKERALVGIGAAIATGCQPCTRILMQLARKAGACERSIRLAVESGLQARVRATEAMASWAEAEQGNAPTLDALFLAEKQRLAALIETAAAYAVNSTATLHNEVEQAEALDWANAQIGEALSIGRAVARTAVQKVEKASVCLGFEFVEVSNSNCGSSRAAEDGLLSASDGCGCAHS